MRTIDEKLPVINHQYFFFVAVNSTFYLNEKSIKNVTLFVEAGGERLPIRDILLKFDKFSMYGKRRSRTFEVIWALSDSKRLFATDDWKYFVEASFFR